MRRKENPACAEELRFCDVPTALDEIRAGRILAIVNDEWNLHHGAIMAASSEPSPETLKVMAHATGGLLFMCVLERDLRQVKLPGCLCEDFVLGAAFPQALPRSSGHQGRGDQTRLPIIPFTKREPGVLRYASPAECVVDLAAFAAGSLHCFFSTFSFDNKDSLVATVRTHSLRVLSAVDLVRYQSPGKEIFLRHELQ